MKILFKAKLLVLTLVISLMPIFFGCKKMQLSNEENNIINLNNASVNGRVTDLHNFPIRNALITFGVYSTTTDIDGRFYFKNYASVSGSGFIKVFKAGYFVGLKTFSLINDAVENIKIELIPKVVCGTFPASSGGIIYTTGGGSVNFIPGSIIYNSTGISYTGNVSVYSFFLNPEDPNCTAYMPGDLLGVNSQNEKKGLQSFGMISIEIDDGSGEKLQIAPGKTATISMPIPNSLQSIAVQTLPLWYFDQTIGIWKEEGSARKENDNYVGTVSHFSFWNCDLPIENVTLYAMFKDHNGNPLTNKLVTISSDFYGSRGGYTDSKGIITGLIPANENLVMKVFDPCSKIIYSENIGSLSKNINLGTINVDFIVNETLLSGTLVSCDNSPVLKGYVQVTIGNEYFNADITNGKFKIKFERCSFSGTPITVIAYDEINQLESLQYNVSSPVTIQDIGQLIACKKTQY